MERPVGPTRQITIVRAGALGDTLLAAPSLALLRAAAPEARFTFIARAEVLPLILANSLADQVWPWELPDWGALFAAQDDVSALTERARAALVGAEAVVVWAADSDGAVAHRLASLGARLAIVAPAGPPVATHGDMHTAVWLAQTLRPLGVAAPATCEELARLTPTLRPPATDIATVEALWAGWRLPQRVVALHPGSGSQAKRWPAAHFAEVARLARDAGYQPLLLAGEADTLALAETRAALAQLGVTAPVAHGLGVATVAALLARCSGYVGCDSGISHLAALVGAPTVAVFGPTDPARWAPLGPHVYAARDADAQLDHLAADAAWAALCAMLPADARP